MGNKLISDDSGSFNDVFFIEDKVIKVHSRFDCDEMIALSEFDNIETEMILYYDYEVLKDIQNEKFTPLLFNSYNQNYRHLSVLEKINGKSIEFLLTSNELVDKSRLSFFLFDFYKHSIEKGWFPLDINGRNIFQITEGKYKIIDFSCFMKKEDIEGLMDDDLREMILNVMSSSGKLQGHIDKIINSIFNYN